jgi:hypothetical protein
MQSGEYIPGMIKASCIILGVTLLLAGISKLRNPAAFAAGVMEYKILPAPLAYWYGHLLPFVEVGIGTLLIAGKWINQLAFISALLFLSFAIAVSVNMLRKRQLSCYCFGSESSSIGWHTIARILLLFSLSAFLAFAASGENLLRELFRAGSLPEFTGQLPVLMIAAFGLALLSIIEVTPEVVRSWTARAVRPPRREIKGIWRRE